MSVDEKLKTIIEILKIIAWPAVLVWLVWYLRDEVGRIVPRMTEIGLAGAKFAPTPPTAQIPTPPAGMDVSGRPGNPSFGSLSSETGTGRADMLTAGDKQSDLVQRYIASLKALISEDQLRDGVEIMRRELISRFGTDHTDQIEGLIYNSVFLNVQLAHERNYNTIFGSQLNLLAQMNVDLGVPSSVAKGIYETAKAANPDVYRTYTFEQWIGFLQNAGLCATAPNDHYVLTAYGRGLLKYILDRHISVNRSY